MLKYLQNSIELHVEGIRISFDLAFNDDAHTRLWPFLYAVNVIFNFRLK